MSIALAVIATVLAVAQLGDRAIVLRDWLPVGYTLLGYWLPASLVTSTNPAAEQKLLAIDRRWFGAEGLIMFARGAPRLVGLLELAYLFCYPLVPAGFACLYAFGFRQEADRYWTAVLLAVFCCYGVLPWLPTRPPRAIEHVAATAPGRIRRLNAFVLDRASIQLNTFPSGHAAASLATALAVGSRLPVMGVLFGYIAVGISIGSVVGRYHYGADAAAGIALAAVAFAISRFV